MYAIRSYYAEKEKTESRQGARDEKESGIVHFQHDPQQAPAQKQRQWQHDRNRHGACASLQIVGKHIEEHGYHRIPERRHQRILVEAAQQRRRQAEAEDEGAHAGQRGQREQQVDAANTKAMDDPIGDEQLRYQRDGAGHRRKTAKET